MTDLTKDFPDAKTARELSLDQYRVSNEIEALENKIKRAISFGSLHLSVSDTLMTSNETGKAYFLVFSGVVKNRVLQEHMERVEKHFRSLGYGIGRKVNKETLDTFIWEVFW